MENLKSLAVTDLDDDDEIEFDPQIFVLDRMDELLARLDEMIAGQTKMAQADIERSQAQLEVLATLQALVRNKVTSNKPVDMTPIKTAISELQAMHGERRPTVYQFDITRDNRGLLSSITAKPQGTITH